MEVCHNLQIINPPKESAFGSGESAMWMKPGTLNPELETKKPVWTGFFCTRGGTWTRTAKNGHWILSPARLPVPPPGQVELQVKRQK